MTKELNFNKADKEETIKKLKDCQDNYGTAAAHIEADGLLLQYINDKDIEEAFKNVKKWYE